MAEQILIFNKFLYPEYNGIKYKREDYILDHSINAKKAERWINSFKNPETGRKLLDIFKHVSWSEFKNRLIACAEEITENLLRTNRESKYFYVENKSTFFFTALLYQTFNSLPKLPKSPNFGEYPIDTHIIADDMIFTGTQIIDYINFIVKGTLMQNYPSVGGNYIQMLEESDYHNRIKVYTDMFTTHKPLKDNEYFVMFYISERFFSEDRIALFTKEGLIMETRLIPKTLLEVSNYIASRPGLRYNEIFETYRSVQRRQYVDINTLNNPVYIYLCIPYISSFFYSRINDILMDYIGNYEKVRIIIPKNTKITEMISETEYYKRDSRVREFFSFDGTIHVDRVSPYYFDHKIAGAVSTVSSYIGCGIIGSEFTKSGEIEVMGSLLNNCVNFNSLPEGEKKEMIEYARTWVGGGWVFGNRRYNQDIDQPICGSCPFPVYKYKNKDFPKLEETRQLNLKVAEGGIKFVYLRDNVLFADIY
jgi:hypothetical protein